MRSLSLLLLSLCLLSGCAWTGGDGSGPARDHTGGATVAPDTGRQTNDAIKDTRP